MSNPDSAKHLVPDRDCGGCTSCCRDLTIESPELKKAPGVLCAHCVDGKGCSIYETRPPVCRVWYCGWRQMPQLDDSWRPDRSEILITPASEHIPAGYPPQGLTFEMTGSLERVIWHPFLHFICSLIADSVPVFLSVRGKPGFASGNIFLNDRLSGVIAMGDMEKIVGTLIDAVEACVDLPKKKIEFDGPG